MELIETTRSKQIEGRYSFTSLTLQTTGISEPPMSGYRHLTSRKRVRGEAHASPLTNHGHAIKLAASLQSMSMTAALTLLLPPR
jgi:hypothetical protein